jgi:hypothetical protein
MQDQPRTQARIISKGQKTKHEITWGGKSLNHELENQIQTKSYAFIPEKTKYPENHVIKHLAQAGPAIWQPKINYKKVRGEGTKFNV